MGSLHSKITDYIEFDILVISMFRPAGRFNR
nr:MAG TPA: hypothetical protein [Caudoviricetes sp.]